MEKMERVPLSMQATVGEPGGLGLFGLALVSLLAASEKLGWTTGIFPLIPWAIFLGAFAQLIASLNDLRRHNIFGATAFGAFALYWFSVATTWTIRSGIFGAGLAAMMDPRPMGFVFIGYLIFSLYMLVAAMETNRVLFSILALISLFFVLQILTAFGVAPLARIAGVLELGIAALGFYGSAATVLNVHFGREFLLVGRPFGWFKSTTD